MTMLIPVAAKTALALGPVRPGLRYGPAPLRKPSRVRSTALDRFVLRARSSLTQRQLPFSSPWLRDLKQRIVTIESLKAQQRALEFKRLTVLLRRKGHHAGSREVALAHAVSVARTALALIPHDVQLMAVRELLHGNFVEMGTGEGKTLSMALAAAVSALDGTPVHVLTASDYLVQRDARVLSPFFTAMDLRVASVVPGMSDEARRVAYQADIVYVTGKQVAFDWLRDCVASKESTPRLASRLGDLVRKNADTVGSREPLLRGLCLAIVDEADSLLVDEARTPLVLAAPMAENKQHHDESIVALTLARLLHEGVDFSVSSTQRFVTLTPKGEEALDKLATRVEGRWRASRYRDEKVRDALSVLHCWRRDRDYVVRDNKIELVDSHTGRALSDRRLQRGLHRLLELKERCEITPENNVVASLPYQQFFRHYIKLAGMSGTLCEVRAELACVYGIKVVRLAPRLASQLQELGAKVFASADAQHDAVIKEVQHCLRLERPVLIGTRTVEQSERVSLALSAHGIKHNLLNASQDSREAAIVEQAGQSQQVTVATNMAGRGTDIALGEGVSKRGGLHVIVLALNDSKRLDRQLAGRAARQGSQGSFVRLLSLDDVALHDQLPDRLLTAAKQLLIACKKYLSLTADANVAGQIVAASHLRNLQRVTAYRVGLTGMAIANRCSLMLMVWVQMKIERRHAAERQRALDASSRLPHHVAIGSNDTFSI